MLYDPKWEVTVETRPQEPWRQLLSDAAAFLEKRGWIQCEVMSEGGYCALGAVFYVDPQRRMHFSQAAEALNRVVGGPIAPWNDAAGRTKEEVVAALYRASAIDC